VRKPRNKADFSDRSLPALYKVWNVPQSVKHELHKPSPYVSGRKLGRIPSLPLPVLTVIRGKVLFSEVEFRVPVVVKLDLLMFVPLKSSPKSWLAFELNVLRRMSFESAAIPFSHNAALGTYLKRWNIRVAANDPLQSAWTKSVAAILNNSERLSAEDVNVVLEDAYVPRLQAAQCRPA